METKSIGKPAPLLKDIAYKKIKESILDEHFAPGSFLSERTLIEFLQMSKTPIKSALIRLEAEGFVSISSKQGIMINDLSLSRIINIYDLRIALETYIYQEVTGKLTEDQMREVEANLAEQKQIVSRLDVKGFTEIDHAFHLLICSFIENEEIYRILLTYQDHLKRITLRHLRKDPERMEQFWKEHCTIYEGLKNGDPRCSEYIKNHLQDAKRKLVM